MTSLAVTAAQNAITMSNVDPSSVKLVLNCCSSSDDAFGDAGKIANLIGCKDAVAMDLRAACSGFLFGVVTASQFLRVGEYCVVVGGDALSKYVDWTDRNSCILFGDGAGAVGLGGGLAGADNGVLGYSLHSDGGGHDDLMCESAGSDVVLPIGPGGSDITAVKATSPYITMNGKKVYSFATREVPAVLKEALEVSGLGVDDVDHLLLHQANSRIMDTVAKRLGIPGKKVICNLGKYGNTSAGSIPLALDEAVREGRVKKGDVIACAGFGAGLSWGGAILNWQGPLEVK